MGCKDRENGVLFYNSVITKYFWGITPKAWEHHLQQFNKRKLERNKRAIIFNSKSKASKLGTYHVFNIILDMYAFW